MTLQELKDLFETTCLAHKDITGFDYGEAFDIAVSGNYTYPMAFLEIPYLLSYDLTNDSRKSVDFALLVLMETPPDDKEEDHKAISDAAQIGDAIIQKIFHENKTSMVFNSVTALSLREFSDDDVAGMRFEFNITTKRDFCGNNYETEFDK